MSSPTSPPASPWARLKASVRGSFGEIVFGMEDGTVSIFGLVFGLAVTAHSADQVLLAGATGAIAAAVSMAAGIFLDYQSSRGCRPRGWRPPRSPRSAANWNPGRKACWRSRTHSPHPTNQDASSPSTRPGCLSPT